MSLTPSIEFRKATAADYSAAILNRETTWSEFHHGMLELGWWNSLPGQMLADAQLPSLASTEIENDPAFRSELLAERMGPGLAYGNVPPPEREDERSITERALRQRGVDFLDEGAWRASPFFRDGLSYEPFTTAARAAAVAEIYDKNRWREQMLARRDAGLLDWTTGFIAAMGGSLPDPANLIAFQGLRAAWTLRAATSLGRVGRAAVVGAGENLAATAALAPFLASSMPRYGDEYGWGDLWLDLAAGAGLGGALSGGAAAWRERGVSGALLELERRQRAAAAGDAAVAQMATPAPQQAFDWEAMFPPDRMFEPASTLSVREATAGIGWHEAQDSLFRVQQAAADLADFGQVKTAGALVARELPIDERPKGLRDFDAADPVGSVQRFVDEVLRVRNDNSPHLPMGRIDDDLARRIREATGLDVTDYIFGLSASELRHTWQRHGPDSPAARNGEKPVTVEDLAQLGHWLHEADRIRKVETRRGAEGIEFTFSGRGGPETVMLHRAGRKALAMQTMSNQRRGGGPDGPDAGTPGGGSPRDYTPETAPGTAVENVGDQLAELKPAYQESVHVTFTGAPPEPDFPAQAKARLAEEEAAPTAGDLAEDPDVQAFEALREAGALTESEIKAYDTAKAEAERMADVEKAYDAAALCVLRII